MKEVSFYTHVGGLDTTQGYGYAGSNIVAALNRLGVKTPYNLSTAPIQLNFTQPYYYQIAGRDDQLKIGYTPWESTEMWETWPDYMNAMDEVWTTNDFCAQMIKDNGVTKPVYIYEHGIENIWTPFRRRKRGPIKFLHVGEPAPRKCGQMVYDAFHDLFGNDFDYQLTIKANGFSTVRYNRDRIFTEPQDTTKNVNLIIETLPIEELISLYHNHDILVYPSYGEGFGFIPLQAMATGMPTIINPQWASYRRFLVTKPVDANLVVSPWPDVHPGRMFEPDFESLKASMLDAVENFEQYAEQAYALSPRLHAQYSWEKVTKKAFDRLLEFS